MQSLPLSIIMPVFNERETVASIAQRVLAEVPVALELIIVDDGSTDGSAEIIDALARNDSRILAIHKTNGGKTSALKAGFERSRGEIVIIQDADLEYDPAEIPHVLQPMDWLQNVRYFCWIVLQVRVLNDDDLASAPLESSFERRGFAAIRLVYGENTR